MTGLKQHWTRYLLYIVPLIFLAYCVKIALKPSDFSVYLEAAAFIAEGNSPYNEWIFVSEGNYCLYFYSPLWAILLIPFSYLPQFVPQFLWLALNLFFLYRIWRLLESYVQLEKLSNKAKRFLLLLSLLLSIRFILYNFEMVQMTVFLLWGGLESMRLIGDKRFILGGALLAFIINVKILPLVLLPYLIYRGKFKAALITVAFLGFYLILPSFFIGWNQNNLLLMEWVDVINPTNAEHLIEADLGPHSLTALIPTLLSPTEGVLPVQRHLFDMTADQAILALNVVRLCLVFLTLYFVMWPPFKEAKSKIHELYALSYLFLLIPLIFPHQQKYAFLCIVPAVFYCLHYLIWHYSNAAHQRGRQFYIALILLVISFLLLTGTTDGLVGRSLNELFQHYKLMTYGALLLIPVLIICKPKGIG